VASESFIYRVINNLKDEMVETASRGVPDIHPWPLPNSFETFQDLDMICTVVLFLFEHELPGKTPLEVAVGY
jgi:hypothetical protein